MRSKAPLAYVGTRSLAAPRNDDTDWPTALAFRSQQAMSMADRASVKIPPGPAEPDAARSLATMASVWRGSSPTMDCAMASTACLSALEMSPPKNVSPTPVRPSSVSSSRVT
jgi:hypothetical protein